MARHDLPGDRLPRLRSGALTALREPDPGPHRSPLFGLRIHHRDAHLVVVDKPPGVVMHPGHPRPQVSMLEMLRRELWDRPGVPAMVHRLDRDTSGLVVFALTSEAARHLGRQFETRRVAKRYRAIVHGRLAADCGLIDLPLGPAGGGRAPARQRIGGPEARAARTRFTVVERGPHRTLVDLFPETGRRHQLRVHLAALGHPLLGDGRYGPGGQACHARHALHAAALAFTHPASGAPLAFESPLPPDLRAAWLRAASAARAALA